MPSHGKDNTQLIITPSQVELARFMPVMAIEQALDRRRAIVDATRLLMTPGVDYGKIPGTDKDGKPGKDCLLQPGAEKLGNIFGLVVRYETVKCVEDWDGRNHGGEPFFFYEIKGRAYRGEFLMGEGMGSCNSWESKYRWRNMERTCPQCNKANIRKSKNGEGWYCWARTGGCGATFRPGDPQIEGQEAGKKSNPDMADIVNTVLKMALKRAKVSTIINATSATEFFTQDVEEESEADPDPRGHKVDIGDAQYGTREAQQNVAERKIAELKGKPKVVNFPLPLEITSSRSGDIKEAFAKLREHMGEGAYSAEFEAAGCRDSVFDLRELKAIKELYRRMVQRAQQEVA